MMKSISLFASLVACLSGMGPVVPVAHGEAADAEEGTVSVRVDFTNTLRDWDGFGVNYVEVAQTVDYEADPQDYGGFSRLEESEREEIIELIFGADGIRPNLIKMFLDPFHQKSPDAGFDHETTTRWMRMFVHLGIRKSSETDAQCIQIITTMYGPPAWATKQKFLRGRDLDPKQDRNLARYMIDWVRFLAEEEGLPVKYLSLHNEGDAPRRWPLDGSDGNIGSGSDYNAFWRPWDVARFLEFMPPMIEEAGLEVGLTPGECTKWAHNSRYWYQWAIYDSDKAMENLALMTSHGFARIEENYSPESIDLLRMKRPDLHAWTTSMSWGGQKGIPDYQFVDFIRKNIYISKVNAVIPWAALQTSSWVGGDPNPGTIIFITDDGDYEIRPQYYFYKQVTRAGQNGMKVAAAESDENSGLSLIAFASNGTEFPDAFVVLNHSPVPKVARIEIAGEAKAYSARRSSHSEKYKDIGIFSAREGLLMYTAPAGSVSTFWAE